MNEFTYYITEFLNHIIGSIPLFGAELLLIATFIVSILGSLFLAKRFPQATFNITCIGLILTLFILLQQYAANTVGGGFFDLLLIDRLSIISRLLMGFSALVIALFMRQYALKTKNARNVSDAYSILLTATLGLFLLVSSTHWLMLYIAIETVSISSYILVAFFAAKKQQSEAAMKYILFGSVCAAIMLYGLSLIYGFTGNLNFASQEQLTGLTSTPNVVLGVAFFLLFTGIGFKLSFVPFHAWTPDVYEGAPTAITAFLATLPKVAVVVLLARILQSWTASPFFYSDILIYGVTAVAIASMLLGNMAALRQQQVKRMMAYSSIGQIGILLMAALVYQGDNAHILLYYLTIYTLMNLAVFIFIDRLEHQLGSTTIADYRGLGKKQPLLFSCFTFVLISLIGLPPTAGFMSKLLVFSSVFDSFQSTGSTCYLLLLIIGASTAAISLFFYFKIPTTAFLKDYKQDSTVQNPNDSQVDTLYILAIIFSFSLLILGLFPSLLLNILK